ncbi:hypothetical protein [Plasticicumulans sp.]|uniref:hypothetical protein n=1 Tax=Plasticicumulans sp. TaxID=2307179 RepID=UPI00394028C2
MNETPNVSELSDIGRVAGNVRSNEKLGGIGAYASLQQKNCGLFETPKQRSAARPAVRRQRRCRLLDFQAYHVTKPHSTITNVRLT